MWNKLFLNSLIGIKQITQPRLFYNYKTTPDKTRAVRVLNGFKNEPFYEFIGEVILKINLI